MRFVLWLLLLSLVAARGLAEEAAKPEGDLARLKQIIELQAAEIAKLKAENETLKARADELAGKATAAPKTPEPLKSEPAANPSEAPERPAAKKISRKTAFTDEKTIRRDWEMKGNWRLQEDGLRLIGGDTTLTSTHAYRGDAKITIAYDLTDRSEIWVFIWGERFDIKESGRHSVVIERKGDTVRFGSPGSKPTGIKLKEANLDPPSKILLHLDRLNLWRPKMEVLIRGISIDGTEMPVE